MTPIDNLRVQAAVRPKSIALFADGMSWNYRQLQRKVDKLACGLLARSVREGDRVALHLPTSPNMVIAYYACFSIGAVAVPLNLRFKGAELDQVLRRLEPALYIGDEDLYSEVRDIALEVLPPERRFVIGGSSGAIPNAQSWMSLFDTPLSRPIVPPAHPDIPNVLLTTSGTTGQPKFVAHTPATLWAMTDIVTHLDLDHQIVVNALPMVHASGLVVMLCAIRAAAPMVLLSAFDADAVLDAVATRRGSWLLGLPFMFQALLDAQEISPRDIRSLRFCCSVGDVCPTDLQRRFSEIFGLPLRSAWGASETVGSLKYGLSEGPVSRVAPGAEIRLVDDHGEPVPRGTVGELLVRGPNVTVGYWHAPDRIDAATTDGWFHTGDLMRQGSGDEIWFVSRKKDLIIRGGSNISPSEVEQALTEHPLVLDAAVMGVADATLGQRVVAAVQLAENTGVDVLKDILADVRRRLADYKIPERLVAIDAIPRNPLGKVDRLSLAAALL